MERPRLSSKEKTSLALALSMLSVFVVLPLGLPIVSVTPLNSMAIAILAIGSLADSLMTKHAFRAGGNELNPLYRLTANRLSQNQFLVALALIKMGLGLAMLVILPNPYLLFLIALYSLSGVLFNSVGLAFSGQSESR